MKAMWNAVSFIAVVNLLAGLMFVGWLWFGDRLDATRVEQIRELLAPTIGEAAEEDEAGGDEAAASAAAVPLPSAAQIQQTAVLADQTMLERRRMADEAGRHLAQLQLRASELETRERAFEEEKAQWWASIEADRARRVDEQFIKTVQQYQSARPKTAKQWVIELVEAGDTDQVVAYLDAMSTRAAGRILGELKTPQEAELATELLERLRTFGIAPEAAEVSSDDGSRASTG